MLPLRRMLQSPQEFNGLIFRDCRAAYPVVRLRCRTLAPGTNSRRKIILSRLLRAVGSVAAMNAAPTSAGMTD